MHAASSHSANSPPLRPLGLQWIGAGDVNAFFGLMLDNLAVMVLAVGLLTKAFGFPAEFALRYMVPGTALGVLFGDLCYTWIGVRLARRTGNRHVTAMPLGLDTPSTFGMVFFVLGPVYKLQIAAGATTNEAAMAAWQVGICALFISGIFKLACALFAGHVRRLVPCAGLLGSLAAIALALISFQPLLDIFASPVVGLLAIVITLGTLIARLKLPFKLPGALAAVLLGGALYYALQAIGFEPANNDEAKTVIWLPTEWMAAGRGGWLATLPATVPFLPVVIPFALATVVGGIDCTESAAAAGDEYDARQIIAVEGLATLVAACCGGVIQSTPYIGHPAYKAMGGRSGYTLATAIFIGSAGLVGYFGLAYAWLPKAAVFPILIFIGLEITAQSFLATPRRHYPAVALACLPALAYLVMIFVDQSLAQSGSTFANLKPALAQQLQTLRVLSNGFIVSSVLWAATLASLVDRRLRAAAGYLFAAAACSLFGVIHSPFPGSPLLMPWNLPKLSELQLPQSPLRMATAYCAAAAFVVVWGFWCPPSVDDVEEETV